MRLTKQSTKTIFAIGDLHGPFIHPDAAAFVLHYKKLYRPDIAVFLGDEVDGHSVSHWMHDPDGHGPGQELELAIESLQPFYKAFPKALVCNSNHTARYHRKAFDAGLPKASIRSVGEILEAPKGWQWKDQWIVDDICFEHGEGYSGQNAAVKSADGNQKSTVIGHVHGFAGIAYHAMADKLIFGMNCGTLVDHAQYSFRYGKFYKRKPVLGLGVIVKSIPIFIPMILDKKDRWIGPK
jgi:hypothetical protein